MSEQTGMGFFSRCAMIAGTGFNPTRLARELGMKHGKVYAWSTGQSSPSYETICAILERYPDADARWLLLGEVADDGE